MQVLLDWEKARIFCEALRLRYILLYVYITQQLTFPADVVRK